MCSLEDQPGTDSEFVGIGNGNCGANDRLMCTAVYAGAVDAADDGLTERQPRTAP